MMKSFPIYVVLEELFEELLPNLKTTVLVEEEVKGKNIKFKIMFNDLYCCLQTNDLSLALLFAEKHFEENLANVNKIEDFIKAIHQYAAKHLVMFGIANKPSGEYRIKDGIIYKTDYKTPMGISAELIPKEMSEFCNALFKKLGNIKKPAEAIDVAIFALGEIGRIHPFENGNGRVGQIIMNCILMHFGNFFPIVFADKDELHECFVKYLANDQAPMVSLFNKLLKVQRDTTKLLTKPLTEINLAGGRNSFQFGSEIIIFDDYVKEKTGLTVKCVLTKSIVEGIVNSEKFHLLVRIFFDKFLSAYWPNVTRVFSEAELEKFHKSVTKEISIKDELKKKEEALFGFTTKFFAKQPTEVSWKRFPEPKLVGNYVGHQVYFFTMPIQKNDEPKQLAESLRKMGFSAEIKPAKEKLSVVVDLNTSTLALSK